MRARWATVIVTLCLFGAALYGMRFVPQQFFPASDRPELLLDLQLPENASIYATKDASARLDELLKGDQDVDHWSTYVGQGAVRFYLPLNVQPPNDFFAQTVVVTKGLKERERVKARLEQALANGFPNVVARVYPLELGPPVGWPLQFRVSGPDPNQVRTVAFKVADLLGSAPGARNVNYNWMEPARTVRVIRVDQDEARLLGAELAGFGPVPECRRIRRHRHSDAQRDLFRRRAGPGVRRSTYVAVHHPHASGAAAERADRSPDPDRLDWLWSGISDHVPPTGEIHERKAFNSR
jgi:multidrug efflux pump subunit AcrB